MSGRKSKLIRKLAAASGVNPKLLKTQHKSGKLVVAGNIVQFDGKALNEELQRRDRMRSRAPQSDLTYRKPRASKIEVPEVQQVAQPVAVAQPNRRLVAALLGLHGGIGRLR